MADKNHVDGGTVTINDEPFRLRMTLGAMAALERILGCTTIKELQDKLSEPSMTDIEAMALVMVRAGGENVPDNFFMTADVNMMDLMEAVKDCTRGAFKKWGKDEGKEAPRGNVKKG